MLPRNLMPRTATAALAALALLVPAVALADTVERTFDVAPGGTLRIDTDQGSIDVSSAPGNQVRIRVEREARRGNDADFELRFDQHGDDVTIEGEQPGSGWFGSRRFRVRFEIEVPQRYNLDLETAGGSISIADLEGDVDCHTSGGSIRIEDIDGKVDCRTSGGGIDIGRIEGSVLAKTSGGNITVDEVLGSIEATTSGGNIKATISQQPQADCRLSTSGGGVEVALASSIAVDLDAKTSGGRVNVDLPVTVQGHLGRSSLQGKVNGGGPQLYLRTSGGSIHIRKIG